MNDFVSRSLARSVIGAAVLTILAADIAAAAPARVASPTNLRQGPGIDFGVITTVPGGSIVDIIRCNPLWCNVLSRGRPGYMIARNLLRVAVVPAPPVIVGPPVVPYYGPSVYLGPHFYGPRRFGPRYYGPRRSWRRRW